MAIPISVFLFLYLIFVAIFLFFTFFNLFHMIKFGFVSLLAYVITFGYIILTIAALFVSYFYIAQVDWSVSFQLFDSTGLGLPF